MAVLIVALSTVPRAAVADGSAPPEDPSRPTEVAELLARGAASEAGPADIDIRFTTPPSPEQARRVLDWHSSYRAELTPVKEAWLAALRVLDRVGFADPAARWRLAERCVALRQALVGVSPDEILPVPDPVVDLYLRRAMVSLQQAARDCDSERLFLVSYRFKRAGQAYLKVARALKPYGVSP